MGSSGWVGVGLGEAMGEVGRGAPLLPDPPALPEAPALRVAAPELWDPHPKRRLTVTTHLLVSPPCPAAATCTGSLQRRAPCSRVPLGKEVARVLPGREERCQRREKEGGRGQPVLPLPPMALPG